MRKMEIRGTTAVVFKIGTLIETLDREAPRLFSHFAIPQIDTKEIVMRAIVAKVERDGDYYRVTSVVFWAKEEDIAEDDSFAWLESLAENKLSMDIKEGRE